jgi:hypothetical protein
MQVKLPPALTTKVVSSYQRLRYTLLTPVRAYILPGTRGDAGLVIDVPSRKPSQHAFAFAITPRK